MPTHLRLVAAELRPELDDRSEETPIPDDSAELSFWDEALHPGVRSMERWLDLCA